MTPLAQEIVKQMLLPPRKRTFEDQCGLLRRMEDIHCFEVTQILDVARDLVDKGTANAADGGDHFHCMTEASTFLPASRSGKTWLEYSSPDGEGRRGFLLVERPEKKDAIVYFAANYRRKFFSPDVTATFGLVSLGGNPGHGDLWEDATEEDWKFGSFQILELQAILALINTPRIVGRQQHMPHVGLERQLRARMCEIGKFPLHAYTEIKLRVSAPDDLSAEKSTEAHLTGKKARHWVRQHARFRLGKIEIVSDHWRGDASLGVKRSRYLMTT